MSAGLDRLHVTRALGWGLFLACSWTWVIGMWLPTFLVRDFGWWGWAAFVVPNVFGAIAMGLTLGRPGLSQAVVERHPGAMRAFSVVTLMFHAFFLTAWLWWATTVMGPVQNGWVGIGVAAVLIIAAWLSGRGGHWASRAAIVFLCSMLAWFLTARTGSTLSVPPEDGARPFGDLMYALPVIFFGFVLCPYLDATFHRARQSCSGRTGDAAFVLGFGLFFLALMVYSLLYAGGLLKERWSYYLVMHFSMQAWFTMSVHFREVVGRGVLDDPATRRTRSWRIGILVLLAFGLGVAAVNLIPSIRGMSALKVFYYLFLAAYALPFPAYVWLVMVDRGAPMRKRLIVWGVAVGLAAPCLWLGFIEGQYVWLLAAAGIPLLAPLALKREAGIDSEDLP